MRIYKGLLFMIVLSVACSCNNVTSDKNTSDDNGPAIALSGTWYKRLTGTIANVPVVVNLHCHTIMSDGQPIPVCYGTYYYVGKSELMDLYFEHDSAGAGWVFTENVMSETATEDDEHPRNKWLIKPDGHKLKGGFYKHGSSTPSAIELKEDYTDATKFDAVTFADSITTGNKWKAKADWHFAGVVPGSATENKELLNRILLHAVGDDSNNSAGIAAFPKRAAAAYFKSFKDEMAEEEKTYPEDDPMSGYAFSHTMWPVYNANRMVCVGDAMYEYSGGAHGNHLTRYVNVDLKLGKQLQLTDIMNVDSVAISAALNESARRSLKMKPNQPLDEMLFVSSVPAVDNFIVSDKGLTFNYAPYEIASFAAGEVILFVPYTRIRSLLKPDFIKRMGL